MAQNLRIVYDNAISRTVTLLADTTAGSLVVTNMTTDLKSDVYRSTATSCSITATWAASETIGVVALPFCNMTTAGTLRVRAYTNVADATPAYDSGAVLANPTNTADPATWGSAYQGVNSFAYGGGSYAVVWIPPVACKKLIVDVADSTNPAGYFEAARLVCGNYWQATNNPDHGSVTAAMEETSKHERADSGDLRTDRGVMYQTLTFSLEIMPLADRNIVWRILKGNGMYRPVFVSVAPQSSDAGEEEIYMVYGKLSKNSQIQYQFLNQFATSLSIEEI
jgi:hypothetical protein